VNTRPVSGVPLHPSGRRQAAHFLCGCKAIDAQSAASNPDLCCFQISEVFVALALGRLARSVGAVNGTEYALVQPLGFKRERSRPGL
jgi:hypothetical protein